MRDDEQHWFTIVDEGLLYLQPGPRWRCSTICCTGLRGEAGQPLASAGAANWLGATAGLPDTAPGAGAPVTDSAGPDGAFGGLHHASAAVHGGPMVGDWQLSVQRQGAPDWHSLDPHQVRNAYLVVGFSLA
jgi:hypothetical protein